MWVFLKTDGSLILETHWKVFFQNLYNFQCSVLQVSRIIFEIVFVFTIFSKLVKYFLPFYLSFMFFVF